MNGGGGLVPRRNSSEVSVRLNSGLEENTKTLKRHLHKRKAVGSAQINLEVTKRMSVESARGRGQKKLLL